MKFTKFVRPNFFSNLGMFGLFLTLVFAYQNCGRYTPLAVEEGTTDSASSGGQQTPAPEVLMEGKALYAQNCASCHNPLDSSSKKSRTSTQISIAISTQPQMAAISLTQAQIDLIAKVLSPEVNTPPPVTNVNNRQEFACTPGQLQKTPLVKLTNREYKAALFLLLDGFATTLKADATLVAALDAMPTDIATENRDTQKEQSQLMTAPISNALFNSAYRASELVAASTTGLQNYPNTSQCLAAATITQACHQSFVRELGSRAFRRPLTTTEANAVAARFFDSTLAKADLLKLTFASIATMPDFLYKIYDKGTAVAAGSTVLNMTAHELAAKMAFFLTGAPPDATLKATADNGTLLTDAVIAQQVDRLLTTAGSRDMVRRLFRESYGYDYFSGPLMYDAAYINNINVSGLADVMTNELDNYFVEVVLNRSGSFLDVMTSKYTSATDSRLGAIYGLTAVTNTLPDERAGFLSRAGMLTKRSGFTASPIKRGLNVIEHVLCQDIGLPPPSAPTSLPPVTEELITTRMRTSRATEVAGTACATCHGRFNSLGYALEGFDSFGRSRTMETIYKNNQAVTQIQVDTSISSSEINGVSPVAANGSRQLGEQLGASDRAMMCFVKHLKRFEARVPAEATANCQMNQSLKTMYGDNTTQGSIVGAIKSLVLSPEFRRWNN